jgi:hypothetical protein
MTPTERALFDALAKLREDVTPAYKAGRIPALSFVHAGNVLADAVLQKTKDGQ